MVRPAPHTKFPTVLLGRLFDSLGRKPMIAFTYTASGILLAVSGFLFARQLLDAAEQTMIWTVIFFLRLRQQDLPI
jgi:MFS family permease